MPEPLQGTPPPAEQPGNGPQQQEQAPTQQAPGQSVEQQTPPAPTLEQLQAEIADRDRRLQQVEESARYHQSQASKYYTALTGNGQPQAQAPQDPLAPYIKDIVAQGYAEKDARVIAGTQYRMVQDMMQPLQQQAHIGQQMANVDYVVQQAMSQDPSLFQSPQAYDQARQAAASIIQNGGQPNPDLLVDMMAAYDYRARRNNPQQQRPQQFAPQQPALPPQPFANGMTRITPGFAPQQQQPVITQDQRAAEDFLNSRFDLKKP